MSELAYLIPSRPFLLETMILFNLQEVALLPQITYNARTDWLSTSSHPLLSHTRGLPSSRLGRCTLVSQQPAVLTWFLTEGGGF